MQRRRFLVVGLSLAWTAWGCAGALTPAEYPPIKVSAAALKLRLVDPRTVAKEELSRPPRGLPSGSSVSLDKIVPESFQGQAQARLERLPSGTGPSLDVEVEVRRAAATHFATLDGEFTRFDVELGFTVRSQDGATLLQMRGAAWNELPAAEATLPEQKRVYDFTLLQAVDNVFASEETLDKLNQKLAAYEKGRQ